MFKIATIIMCLSLATEPGILGMIIEKIKTDSTSIKAKRLQKLIIILFLIGAIGSTITMISILKEKNTIINLIIFAIFVSQLTGVFLSFVLYKDKK